MLVVKCNACIVLSNCINNTTWQGRSQFKPRVDKILSINIKVLLFISRKSATQTKLPPTPTNCSPLAAYTQPYPTNTISHHLIGVCKRIGGYLGFRSNSYPKSAFTRLILILKNQNRYYTVLISIPPLQKTRTETQVST